MDTLTKYDYKCINFKGCGGKYTSQTLIFYCDNPKLEPDKWAEGDRNMDALKNHQNAYIAAYNKNIDNGKKHNNNHGTGHSFKEMKQYLYRIRNSDESAALLPDPKPNDKGEYETWRCPICNHLNSALWSEKCVGWRCNYPFKEIPINTTWTKEMPTNPQKFEY